ncbi:MAG: sigma-70 family RNA polymerase sigma factor [Verrucomicrobiales bacterium]|nr:sigma-70 family RNA polymerase sigma factor [Verrucomicrobiales bacterium]
MSDSTDNNQKSSPFPETRWTIINVAQDQANEKAFDALSDLCEAYWYPLYGFLRSTGSSEADAQDLIQGFLAMMVEKDYIKSADREKGKLRTFLLDALTKYRAKDYRKQNAQKRGGNVAQVSIDQEWAEGRYEVEPEDDSLSPEQAFDRRWAAMILDSAFHKLRLEFEAKGKEKDYEVLSPFLSWNSGEGTYLEAAQQLETSESNIKVKVHRMRHRLRDIIEEESKHGLNSAMGGDLVDELRILMGAG